MPEDPKLARMQCMEVWGGNAAVERALTVAGLDIWVYSRPHAGADAGGDVHYVSTCGSGRVTRVLLADISGHGEIMAEVAASLRALMHRYVNYIDHGTMVRRMNARFHEFVSERLFATALVGTFFAPTRHVTISNAGHPPPLLYRSAAREWMYLEDGSDSTADIRNTPLGVVSDAPYSSLSARLERGDHLLWYTDSLIEICDDAGQMIGKEGLLEWIRGLPTTPGPEFVPSLLDAAAHRYHVTLGDNDDVTLILMRCTGDAEYAPLKSRLKGMGRFMRRVVGLERDENAPVPWPEWSIPNILGGFVPLFNRLWRPGKK